MGRLAQASATALLVLALSACTGGGQEPAGGSTAPAGAAATAEPSLTAAAAPAADLEAGTDVGNGRPASSHDGLMVQRRIVVAIHPSPNADVAALRKRLYQTASAGGMALSSISPTVLDAAVLDHLVPELIAALPAGRSKDDGERLAERAFGKEGSFAGVEHVHVGSVLVHDLAFRIATANPKALAAAIATEGILADALGNYQESFGARDLTIGYTGPLLSDALVESVRAGMARGAGVRPAAVQLRARSAAGTGVDLSKEPAPAPAEAGEDDSGHHDAGTDDSGHHTGGDDGSDH